MPLDEFANPGSENVGANRAPVSPRVRLHPGQASLPIERQIRTLIEKRVGGAVQLVGEPGSGKTTALRHLAAALDAESPVALLDRPPAGDRPKLAPGRLLLYTSILPADPKLCVTLEMSPWTGDDHIEYLLATHPGRCRAVMDRLRTDARRAATLRGLPELWRIVLDEMAADDSVANIDAAFDRYLSRFLLSEDEWERAGRCCLHAIAPWAGFRPEDSLLAAPVARLLRHAPVQRMLAARHLARGLADRSVYAELQGELPAELIDRAGQLVICFPAAVRTLESMATSMNANMHAMAVSLLHAAGTGWRPKGRLILDLTGARLPGIHWDEVELPGSEMPGVDFRRAVLDSANFSGATLDRAALMSASLRQASLKQTRLTGADLRDADLGFADADEAHFDCANLTAAQFHRASLRKAQLRGADLTRTAFVAADLTDADLLGATLDGTDFTGTALTRAILTNLPLRRAILNGARLRYADLRGCDLEGVVAVADFSRADLRGALLTGAVLRGANFRNADLRDTRLAEIDWEGVDLRDADLRGSTFHMGSTRSGLVGSDVVSEGTRTGFYTDDFQDRDFKDPAEIRKANLTNADLRGANLDRVDFYLVDLRGARYTPEQALWFARCGAIL